MQRLSLHILFYFIAACNLQGAEVITRQDEIAQLEKSIAQGSANLDTHYRLGILYHHEAQEGSEEAIDKALTHFAYVFEQDSTRLDARAFYGSVTVLQARFASLFSKLSHAQKGFEILDQAVEKSDKKFSVVLIRAINSHHCPRMLGRSKIARSDFSTLLAALEQDPDQQNPVQQKITFFYAGLNTLKRDKKAGISLIQKAYRIEAITDIDQQLEKKHKELTQGKRRKSKKE